MDESTFKQYLAEDYVNAIKFYDDRACSSKRWYRGLSAYLILGTGSLTPLIALAPNEPRWRAFAVVLSATIVIATGLLAHLKSHENWLSYRASWDALKRERRFHETGTGPYQAAGDPNAMFVERVEAILTREGADFYARHTKGDEQAKNPDKKG